MRKIGLVLLAGMICLTGSSCGKKWVPDVKMPKVFREKTPEEKAQEQAAKDKKRADERAAKDKKRAEEQAKREAEETRKKAEQARKQAKESQERLAKGQERTDKVQKQIDRVLETSSEAAFLREIANLLDVARDLGWDNRQLLTAVVDYSARLDSNNQETFSRYHHLLGTLQVPKTMMVDVAAPRLAVAQGGRTDATRALLRWSAPPAPHGRVDFSHFHRYLEIHQAQPPQDLILWMYNHDPASAMWTLKAVYGSKSSGVDHRATVLGEHVINEILWRQENALLKPDEFGSAAAEQLDRLSQSDDWWVRLYVAEILAKNPRLRKADVIQRLQQDANPIVVKSIERAAVK